jgi:hypothetical protein
VGLKLCLYDRTERGRGPLLGLTHVWATGSAFYRGMGRVDRARGVSTWEEGLAWLASVEPEERIAEIQFWGHGNWGNALVDRKPLDVDSLASGHPHRAALEKLRARLVGPEALVWFRTCETLGTSRGQRFAAALADFLGCRVAGHTFIIAFWQSGLHLLEPGKEPHWDPAEGLAEGTPAEPVKARWSARREPNTISCLAGRVPHGW